MNEFIEKWKNDKKYQTKIKLLLYTLFVVFVSIFAISGRNTSLNNANINEEKDISQSNTNIITYTEDEYNYNIVIKINEDEYQYTKSKTKEQETIIKTIQNEEFKYILKNNTYYKYFNNNYILTSENEVYDIINHDLIEIKTINEYLKNSIQKNNQYQINIKDLILESDNQNTITITINDNIIEIDYTELMKEILDTNIDRYLVQIKIEQE